MTCIVNITLTRVFTIMAKLDPPEKFSFKPNEWVDWIEEFGRYRRATRLHKEDGDIQRDTLIYVMGGKQANSP